MKVNLKDIKITNRKRQANPQKVKDLAQSISHLGLLNPITVTPDLRLLAGLHRTEACRLLGHKKINVVIKDLNSLKEDLVEIDENLIRSELSIMEQGELLIERDEILSSLGLRAKSGDNRWNRVAGSATLLTNKDISKDIGISDRTIRERKQIARGIVPEVREQLRNTRYADNAHGLLQLTRQPAHIQKIAVKKVLSGEASRDIKIDINEPRIIKVAIEQAYREHNIQKWSGKSKNFKIPKSVTLYCGDFKKISKILKPCSIDLLLTDPLWSKEGIGDFKALGDVAMRLLKPSKFFISYIGTMYMPEIMNHLLEAGLLYHWMGITKFALGRNTEWQRRVWSYKRHFVVMYKPPVNHKSNFFMDVLETDSGKEKGYHKYQQGIDGFKYLITRFTSVGDTVMDPCLGGGTTVLAALSEKRKCIGIDVDPKAIKATKARIAEYLKTSI